MSLPMLAPEAGKAGAGAAVVAAAQQSATSGTITVDVTLYSLIAVALSLLGVWLARLITVESENRALGRRQTWRETGPLTWVGILIVAPFIWHFRIDIPWAALMGLGVGYSVRLCLKILGRGVTGGLKAMVSAATDQEAIKEGVGEALKEAFSQHPPHEIPEDQKRLLDRLEED